MANPTVRTGTNQQLALELCTMLEQVIDIRFSVPNIDNDGVRMHLLYGFSSLKGIKPLPAFLLGD